MCLPYWIGHRPRYILHSDPLSYFPSAWPIKVEIDQFSGSKEVSDLVTVWITVFNSSLLDFHEQIQVGTVPSLPLVVSFMSMCCIYYPITIFLMLWNNKSFLPS